MRMRNYALTVVALTLALTAAPSLTAQEKATISFDSHDLRLSPEVVVDPKDGAVRLAHSVLVADELGATDFRQGESLSERVWAKKVLVLDSPEVTNAELFFYGSAKQVRVNGRALGSGEPLVSTSWTRLKVPTTYLKAGENEVVFSGEGSLLIEPSRQPGRSFKSRDGGRTWSSRSLGAENNKQGEYLVRLRLGRYAAQGWLQTPVFDLWQVRIGEVAVPGRVVLVEALDRLAAGQPEGTSLVPWLRTGSTPTPDPKSWTDWVRFDKDYRPAGAANRHRWAQLKFDLATTRPQRTPRLPAQFKLAYTLRPDTPAPMGKLLVEVQSSTGPRITSVPFVYEEPSPRLKLLRERYQLDKVIAPGQTEKEQLMLLRHWVRNQWHTAWGGDAAGWMPPWDALVILESKDHPDCLTMCTHYAAVFTQCCLALGWDARHCILDHHCVSEVYVNQHKKWVMMDAGNSAERADVTLHFERQGVPLGALELHLAQRSGKTEGIEVHFTPAKLAAQIAARCRPAPAPKAPLPARPDVISLADMAKFHAGGLESYRRFAFPARNNYLTTLFPGELYQGWSNYYYDGYCWVGDSPDEPGISPEYTYHLSPTRPQDIDWHLNWTRIHLARTSKSVGLQVDLETLTPNLARLEMTTEDARSGRADSWKPTPAAFVWKLKPGKNTLRVRSMNHWERAGVEARVQVQAEPADR
jgi:hypothetical protein